MIDIYDLAEAHIKTFYNNQDEIDKIINEMVKHGYYGTTKLFDIIKQSFEDDFRKSLPELSESNFYKIHNAVLYVYMDVYEFVQSEYRKIDPFHPIPQEGAVERTIALKDCFFLNWFDD